MENSMIVLRFVSLFIMIYCGAMVFLKSYARDNNGLCFNLLAASIAATIVFSKFIF